MMIDNYSTTEYPVELRPVCILSGTIEKNRVLYLFRFNRGGPTKFEDTYFPNYHPLSENRDFSTNKHPCDLKPTSKLEFVRCSPVEQTRALYLPWFNCGGRTSFDDKKIIQGFLATLPIFNN